MSPQMALDLLMQHADALIAGKDLTLQLAREYPELTPWLELARTVRDTLLPMTPAADFSLALRRDLLLAFSLGQPAARPSLVLVGAVVGSLVSVVGIALVRARHLRQLRARPLASG